MGCRRGVATLVLYVSVLSRPPSPDYIFLHVILPSYPTSLRCKCHRLFSSRLLLTNSFFLHLPPIFFSYIRLIKLNALILRPSFTSSVFRKAIRFIHHSDFLNKKGREEYARKKTPVPDKQKCSSPPAPILLRIPNSVGVTRIRTHRGTSDIYGTEK